MLLSYLNDLCEKVKIQLRECVEEVEEESEGKRPRSVHSYCVAWGWLASQTLALLTQYPRGVTETILITEICNAIYTNKLFLQEKQWEGKCKKNDTTLQEEGAKNEANQEEHRAAWDLMRRRGNGRSYAFYIRRKYVTCSDVIYGCIETITKNTMLLTDEERLPSRIRMRVFVHQKHRAMMTMGQEAGEEANATTSRDFPFYLPLLDRRVLLTGVKLLEERMPDMDDFFSSHQQEMVILPTEYMAFLLDRHSQADQRVLCEQTITGSRVLTSLRDTPDYAFQKLLGFRVCEILPAKQSTVPGHLRMQILLLTTSTCSVMTEGDESPLDCIAWILWDDQIVLRALLDEGDFVYLWRPFVQPCTSASSDISLNEMGCPQGVHQSFYFMYGSATILFLQQHEEKKDIVLTHTQEPLRSMQEHEVPMDQHGFRDFASFPIRQLLSDAVGSCINTSFYGMVVDVKSSRKGFLGQIFADVYGNFTKFNHVLSHEKRSLSEETRVVYLRIFDGTGCLDIELVGSSFEHVLQFKTGQHVFIEGVVLLKSDRATLVNHPHMLSNMERASVQFFQEIVGVAAEWDVLYGKQSRLIRSRIFNVNTLTSILTSLPFAQPITLFRFSKSPPSNSVHCRAFLSQASFGSPDAPRTQWVHSRCRLPLIKTSPSTSSQEPIQWQCTFCDISWLGRGQGMLQYSNLVVSVDDGTLQIQASCPAEVVETLLQISASDFDQYSLASQDHILSQIDLTEWYMILSQQHLPQPEASTYRIDAAIPSTSSFHGELHTLLTHLASDKSSTESPINS